jgi:predicted transposase YbfD/YdcC
VARALLAELDLAGWVLTGDAQYCQRDVSAAVVAAGGEYLWSVKANQPSLLEAITTLFTLPPPGERFAEVTSRTRHGDRQEVRRLQCSAALSAYLDWPALGQVCRIERTVRCKGRTRHEVGYAVTSLRPAQAGPVRLLRLWRGHWQIENRLHWVRDVTFDEDRCQVRTRAGPQGLAAVRNTVIAVLRRSGYSNIAAGLRRCAAQPALVFALLGLTQTHRL